MRKSEGTPPDTHCRKCGAQLEVRNLSRPRVGGLFGHRQWQADMVCPSCGTTSGSAWTALTAVHPPKNPFMRIIFRLKQGGVRLKRTGPDARLRRMMRERSAFRGNDGHLDLSQLLAAAPFPVYGLKGRPLELRLRSPGWGGRGSPGEVYRAHMGYVAGEPWQPEQALDITQGPSADGETDELRVIESLIHNYGPKEQRDAYFSQGDIHKDWNLERVQQASRKEATIHVGGMDVEVRLASWDEPQRVILARLTLGDNSLRAASLNISQDKLLEALSTLVALQGEEDVLADHQRSFEELRRDLIDHHNRDLT